MKKILLLAALLADMAFGQAWGGSQACIFSGSVADCLPTSGLLLRDQRDLRLGEAAANGSNYVAHQAPATLAGDYTLTWPVDDGTSNQVLQTDGSGVLSWISKGETASTTITSFDASNGTTFVDSSQTLTLAAGSWRISYFVMGQLGNNTGGAAAVIATMVLADTSNNEYHRCMQQQYMGNGASSYIPFFGEADVTIGSSTTFKLRIATGGASTGLTISPDGTSIVTNNVTWSKIKAERI